MSDPFFHSLKKKLWKRPSKEFEGAFWQRFESEFGTSRRAFQWQWAVPVAAVLALVLYWKQPWRPTETQMMQQIAQFETFEDAQLVAVLEMFEGEDLSQLSDEEWHLLLEEKSG